MELLGVRNLFKGLMVLRSKGFKRIKVRGGKLIRLFHHYSYFYTLVRLLNWLSTLLMDDGKTLRNSYANVYDTGDTLSAINKCQIK